MIISTYIIIYGRYTIRLLTDMLEVKSEKIIKNSSDLSVFSLKLFCHYFFIEG